MKKKLLKELCRKAVAAAAGAALLIQTQVPMFVKAARVEYLSEVFLCYDDDLNNAKNWLKNHGYEYLYADMNGYSGSEMSLFAPDSRAVCFGYKTTTNRDEAITDMRVMNMNGGYSFDEYGKLLEAKKTEIKSFVEDMKSVLKEYRDNYRKGADKAKIAHDNLNTILDDDCGGKPLGDLLLKPIKEEMTAEEYEAAKNDHVDMVTLVMQGNTDKVCEVMSYLACAADVAEDTWLERLESAGGIEDLFSRYEEEYPKLSESKLEAVMKSDYDEDAKILAGKIVKLRGILKAYTGSELKSGADEAAITKYFEDHPKENELEWCTAGAYYFPLADTVFGDDTLASFIMDEKIDFDDEEARMDLYPILDAMSEGQRCVLEYVDLGEMALAGSLDLEAWKNAYEGNKKSLKDTKETSLYIGVDRSIFDPAGIALTSEAREIQNTTGASYVNQLFDIDADLKRWVGFGTSAAMGITGFSFIIFARTPSSEFVAAGEEAIKNFKNSSKTLAKDLRTIMEDYGVSSIKLDSNAYVKDYGQISRLTDDQVLVAFFDSEHKNLKIQGTTNKPFNKEFFDEAKQKLISLDDKNEKLINDTREYYNKVVEYDTKMNARDDVAKHFNKEGWQIAGAVLCIAAAALAIATLVITVYDSYQYYHREMAPIPRKMVHENTDEKGRSIYTIYDCVRCNRKNDTLGDCGDLNGDVGKEWLALYTTKDKAAGDPIIADFKLGMGSSTYNFDRNSYLKMFGRTDPLDIDSTEYTYYDKYGGLYLFYNVEKDGSAKTEQKSSSSQRTLASVVTTTAAKKAPEESAASEGKVGSANAADSQAPVTGTVVGTGTMAVSCAGSAAVGALICFLLTKNKRKKGAAA